MNTVGSHWIVEHNILSRQLQQHRIIEEFVDADILAQTLKKILRETSDFAAVVLLSIVTGVIIYIQNFSMLIG